MAYGAVVAHPSTTRAPSPRRQVDLLALANGFVASARGITTDLRRHERTWVLLAVTDLFEAWAIGWPPGGKIELHDHGPSRGAVIVVDGTLSETTVRAADGGVALIGSRDLEAGEHRTFGPGYVHDLVNTTDEHAVSVHVYGPQLSTMTYYELDPHGWLEASRTEQVPPVGPFDVTSTHDRS